jgi:hypothetical protein
MLRTGDGAVRSSKNRHIVKKLSLGLAVFLAGLIACGSAAAGGPTMLIGATEDAVRQPTLAGAKAQMDLLRLAGFNAVRVTQEWAPGETEVSATDLLVLRNVVAAARLDGVTVVLGVMNHGSRTTPLTDQDREQFASYTASIARALPQIRSFVIGNEPNINGYWLPQFNLDGSDAAAPAYEALLAETYDALKAVSPKIQVLGGALSPHGSDDPSLSRPTHSPTGFITDMGAAYRASGRTTPIMDGLAFHPYEDNSSIAPDRTHPNSTTIALADYDKLVGLLGQAFDGTAQPGSTLPIYDDEFGVEAQIPADKATEYTGIEPSTVKPVPESVQGQYYQQAVQIAFCQPNLRGLFLFHTEDETNLNRWQSGLFYPDGNAKSDLPVVRRAIAQAHRGIVARCPGLALRPRATVKVLGSHLRLTCDIDCNYAIVIRSGRRTVAQLKGRGIGTATKTIRLGRLAPGSYSLTATLRAPVNPGPPRLVRASFAVT